MLKPLSSVALATLSLLACDAFPGAPVSPEPLDPIDSLAELRMGTVHWDAVDTDCPDGAWDTTELGMGLVEGDTITLWFETIPELTGTLGPTRDQAIGLTGAMTFPGETGATVSCVVDGTAAVSDAEVAGEMTERLSSEGDVNCVSRGRYRFVFGD